MKSRALFLLALTVLLGGATPSEMQVTWSRAAASELLGVVETVGAEGLDSKDYHPTALRDAIASGEGSALQRAADETFLHLAADFTDGHMRNRQAVRWYLPAPRYDVAAGRQLMATALAGKGVRTTLQGLLPQHRQYRALKAALAATNPRDKAGALRLRANLERWRWMPRDFGRRYLLVNVPAFTVSLIEDNKVVSRRRVIVGKPATPTPQFSAMVTGVILNPWWDIPPSIVRESVGRVVANEPAQARQRGYVVVGGRYRQRPGPGNALGLIKLVMPNPFNVYLHDTPNKALFDAEIRAFSHGCIRTQDPFGLAELLLNATPGWDRARIDSIVADGKSTHISLGQPLPVYVAYFTTAAEENGEMATFPDIYGRDPTIVSSLIDRERSTAP